MVTREELNKEKQKKIIDEENREKRKKIVLKTIKIMILTIVIMTSTFFYITYISNKKIIVNEKRIISTKLPENFNGLKIIQISDIHYGTTIFENDLKHIVNLVNKRQPDIVVFTGDLIDKDYKIKLKEKEKIISILKSLKETTGKYAVNGEEDKEEFNTIMNQSEFTILNNEHDLIYKDNNNPIMIIGLNSSIKKERDIDKSFSYFNEPTHNPNIFTITLLHEPDSVDNILNKYKSDIILAGHSHNGQINFPYMKTPFKKKDAKKYKNSYYKIKSAELFISSGLGTNGSGVRLFTHPSINFFRLSSK